MKTILLCTLLFCQGLMLSCQPDNNALLNEATTKLKDKSATVSSILTDNKYLPIHPVTAFRELIKVNATTDILSISTPAEPGKKIKVTMTLTTKEGKAIPGALVYLYQTDSRGWYAADAPHVSQNEGDMRHARLFGYVKTDANGKMELHTVKPSGYPRSDLPAHIHVHVSAPGYRSYVTEFLFDDDDRLFGTIREQSIRSQFPIAKPEKTTAPFEQQFSYTLVLEKE